MKPSIFKIIKGILIRETVTDSLTNINNVDGFSFKMGRQQARGLITKYAFIYFNIKNFKYYNKVYTFRIGSVIMHDYVNRLKSFLQKDEHIGRLGGDNYIVALYKENLDFFLKQLTDLKIMVTKADGSTTHVDISSRAGVYLAKEGDIFNNCMDAASIAFGETRKNNRNSIIFYDPSMQESLMKQRRISGEFREGLLNHEFEVYYQPKVDVKTHKLCGAEALVRWNKNGNIVYPVDFIPVLEMEGYIEDLDFYVLAKVCEDIKKWIDEGIEPVRISTNFSRIHLFNDDIGETILQIIYAHKINPKFIEFEITETVGYEDRKILSALIAFLKANGITSSIDDFGTGYSSLNFIRDLDVDNIKLDKSFIDDVCIGNTQSDQLVKNVVHLIKDLGHAVIVEGVETQDQANFVTEINCDVIQGYLFDKPLPKEEFKNRLLNKQY